MSDDAKRGAKGAESPDVGPHSLRQVFPDAAALFRPAPASLESAFKGADVVLDTNVLLLPYTTGKDSVDETAKVLRQLAKDGRLFVPGQVAREYAKNRPHKVGQVVQHIADTLGRSTPSPAPALPMLEGVAAYTALKEIEEELQAVIAKYQRALKRLLEEARGWGREDPVSKHYAKIFKGSVVVDPQLDEAALQKEAKDRYAAKIPPGYKDGSKDDGGVGDLAIWKSILAIAANRKRDLVFVSGDEKSDWVHRASNLPLMPRVELIDEFRRASGGRAFYMVQLSHLLELAGAGPATVDGIRVEEARLRDHVAEQIECPSCQSMVTWRIGMQPGSSAQPLCPHCGARFHAHRKGTELVIRARRSRAEKVEEMCNWFRMRYKDPADGVSYDGREGGYQYINGDPFDAGGVLEEQFGKQMPQELIEEAVREIERDGTYWVRRDAY